MYLHEAKKRFKEAEELLLQYDKLTAQIVALLKAEKYELSPRIVDRHGNTLGYITKETFKQIIPSEKELQDKRIEVEGKFINIFKKNDN